MSNVKIRVNTGCLHKKNATEISKRFPANSWRDSRRGTRSFHRFCGLLALPNYSQLQNTVIEAFSGSHFFAI